MDDIFVKDKVAKPKRKLSQKQLDALARGRLKSAENRKQKKINIKLEQEGVVMKKEQKAVYRDKLKEQNALEVIRIKERENKKRNEIFKRQERWTEARIKTLSKCETETHFNQISKILDEAEPEDFIDEDGISKRFSKYII